MRVMQGYLRFCLVIGVLSLFAVVQPQEPVAGGWSPWQVDADIDCCMYGGYERVLWIKMSGEKEFDVVIVGSCVQDLISYTPRFPKPGESVRGSKFLTSFGGKGANQAVQSAKLGAKVAFIGKLGNDVFGKPTIENFKRYGVNTTHCKCFDGSKTGTATITVSDTGENSIVVILGANEEITADEVSVATDLIKSAKVLACQLEIPQDAILEAFKIAKANGVKVIFNPAPGLPDLNRELLQYVDLICPNENEKIATMIPATATVLITLGPNGCVVKQPGQSPSHIPTTKVKAIDTTGAGDSFVGSLSYFLSCFPTISFEDAVSRSLQIASISVQSPGTQVSYPPRHELPQKLFE